MITSTISWTELIWTLSSLIAFMLFTWSALECFADRNYVNETNMNGSTRITTLKNIRDTVGFGTISAIFSMAGIYQCAQPPAVLSRPVTTGGIIIGLSIFTTNFILAYLGIYGRFARRRMIEIEQEEIKRERQRVIQIQREVRELAQQ